jgi:hypothetical protein
VDGRCEGGPEKDGCHELEDTCAQMRRLEDGREGGQGRTRTVSSLVYYRMSVFVINLGRYILHKHWTLFLYKSAVWFYNDSRFLCTALRIHLHVTAVGVIQITFIS